MGKIPGATVTALDLSPQMLAIARKKYPGITFHEGYAEALPFKDASFDIVSAGFGVRNFEDLEKGMQEFHRVLKPGGSALIIEPMIPRAAILKKLYLIYFKKVLPKIAGLFSKSTFAYDYLPTRLSSSPRPKHSPPSSKKPASVQQSTAQ